MKIRHRLIISFIIAAVVPIIILAAVTMGGVRSELEIGWAPDVPPGVIQHQMMDIVISGSIILMITSTLLILWSFQGVMSKLDIIIEAAREIKEGNLENPIEVKGNDEITEVAVAFEEMRVHLKEDAKERLEVERNQRQLVSNIAHDLKTPITAIRGYSEGLLDGVADTPDKRKSYLLTIHKKAEEMDALINELTAYSKLDTNQIPYNFTRLNVRKFFGDVSDEIQMDLTNQGVAWVYYNYVEEDEMFVADPMQLERAIHNCIGNSIKYQKEDVPLTIHFGVWREDEHIRIEIKDNGIGIDKKDLAHVFERLYRGDESRVSAGGSGIGLSIVKKVIEDHGGQVGAISSGGDGTTIWMSLKRFVPEEEKVEQDTDRRRRRGNRRTREGLSGVVRL